MKDYRQTKLHKTEARKLAAEIVSNYPNNIVFSRHALQELQADNLTTGDAWNILKSSDSRILDEGEFEKGSYRYRLETNFIMVVIAFQSNGQGLVIITAWDKRNKNKGG
jgi:hypothetical protein